MISPLTGEVVFATDFLFRPHVPLSTEHLRTATAHPPLLSRAGWNVHLLGTHTSEYGRFAVRAISDPASHIQAVLMKHLHPFYDPMTPRDAERRIYHEHIIDTDLHGQQEFPWGEVFCRVDEMDHQDWLIVLYATGPAVGLQQAEQLQVLLARASL